MIQCSSDRLIPSWGIREDLDIIDIILTLNYTEYNLTYI